MTALELAGVGKRYWQIRDERMLLRSILPFARKDRTEMWALRDIDLKVEAGETVGVLGRNGAGKTTLLRLLAGVSRPSAGEITINGRVAPLIGVGVGFHQEMSGRENVYVNGMLLGMTRAEIDERYDDIVAFSEIGDFIDTPVKFYSSGMFLRLGFAVAIHVEPQVLLVDEVLAVGDIAFQLKCFDKMRQLKAGGTTILVVSHSMHAIRLLCPRALLFRRGELVLDGDPEAVISKHHELLAVEGRGDETTAPVGGVTVVERELLDAHGVANSVARQRDVLRYRVRLRFEVDVESPLVYFGVVRDDGTAAYDMKPVLGFQHRDYAAGDEAEVEIEFVANLAGGTYRLLLTVTSTDGRTVLVRDHEGQLLYLPPPLGVGGIADLEATVSLDGVVVNQHDDPLLG